MKKIVIVYDDIQKPNNKIKTIIGDKSFGNILLKRQSIFNRYEELIATLNQDFDLIKINEEYEYTYLQDQLRAYKDDTVIIHIFSNYIFTDFDNMINIIKKSAFIKENIKVVSSGVAMLMFANKLEYIKYSQNNLSYDYSVFEAMQVDCLIDLSDYESFLQYISGGFDARFFNSVVGDEYTVIKTSTDKKKMKMEYTYYHLLPDSMKTWMVMPYNYLEEKEKASYTMERVHTTDIAIRWTHGAIDTLEFENIMKKTFRYVVSREKKKISEEEYKKISDNLFLTKIDERIEKLKTHSKYHIIESYIKYGTPYENIDEIVIEYKKLYKRAFAKSNKSLSVISHGDLCFSNMLYNKDISLLKLIDPKGALKEEDLWTNPYYDLAKLSHSVWGLYDFFNCGQYNIVLSEDLKYNLNLYFNNNEYVEIFKKYLSENGFDYKVIRIYEISLFLSMLPLHIDYPRKVFGFLLNAINIIKEVS